MIRLDFSTDPYMGLVHRRGVFNCLDFVGIVWRDLTGEDIRERLRLMLQPIGERRLAKSHVASFEKLSTPQEPCLVVMHVRHREPHIGVYFRKKVLHLGDQFGAMFQPLSIATLGYRRVSYYR